MGRRTIEDADHSELLKGKAYSNVKKISRAALEK